MSRYCQFYGSKDVLKAFESRGVKAWSLWQDKQFLTKGMDSDELKEFLTMIENGSDVTYTLKVYEDVEDVKTIKEKTECDGSFNFRVKALEFEGEEDKYHASNKKNKLFQRLEKIEEKIYGPPEEEEETFGKVMMGLLKNPGELALLIEIGKSLLGIQPANTTQAIQKISGITGTLMSTDEKLNRLGAAIDRLEQEDPRLIEHLEKLVEISTTNKEQFKFFLSTLDQM